MITLIALSIAGAVIATMVGTFWYMPHTPMGKIHLRYLGFDQLSPEEQQKKIAEAKPQMPKLYAGQIALSFLTAFAVVFIVSMSIQNGVPAPMAIGFVVMNWLCFMVPAVGSSILWGNCDRAIAWKKFFSDISSHLVIVLLIALMTSLIV